MPDPKCPYLMMTRSCPHQREGIPNNYKFSLGTYLKEKKIRKKTSPSSGSNKSFMSQPQSRVQINANPATGAVITCPLWPAGAKFAVPDKQLDHPSLPDCKQNSERAHILHSFAPSLQLVWLLLFSRLQRQWLWSWTPVQGSAHQRLPKRRHLQVSNNCFANWVKSKKITWQRWSQIKAFCYTLLPHMSWWCVTHFYSLPSSSSSIAGISATPP